MQQGSGLSPLLFVIVMKAICRDFRVALPWELLYADDLAVIGETEEELIKRLNEWKETIRYDTRCYFNVRSKADISQLNLPHGTDN